jgi:peptide/nickel transport system substrate-binding protein
MDADGNFDPYECEDWEVPADGMSVTLTLRDDIYFTSGNHMTSKDLQFTLMRPVNDRTMISARTYSSLENVEIVDDYTVKLVMNSPWPTCIEDINSLPVLDSAEFEKLGEDAYFAKPSTAGPFKIVNFDAVNSSYELERFDEWWGWDVFENPTNVDRIFYTLSAEDTTRVSALRTREFDIIELVPFDDTELLKDEGFQVLETIENRHIMLGCNYAGIFGNQDLREAVSLAINRALIVDTVIGIGWPAKWAWSQGMASNPNSKGYEYNMDKAKEIVSENYDGNEISLLTSSAATARVNELAQAIQSMLMEAGFNVKINMMEEATYDVMRSSGQYDLAIGVFNCTAIGEAYKECTEIIGADIFATSCDDEELFRLCQEVNGNCDFESRKAAEIAVYQHVMDNFGPYLYLYCTTGIKACNDRVDINSMNVDASGNWNILHLQVS